MRLRPKTMGLIIYVGSTSQPLRKRLCEHRYRAKNFLKQDYCENNRLYTRMVTVGIMNWKVIPLLTFACDQKTIFEFEREWVLYWQPEPVLTGILQ